MGMEIKSKLYKFYKWEHFWLVVIVLATLIMHLAVINQPSDIFFDEKHYIPDARSISENATDLRPEHPPLAKLILVADMQIFGDNPWGWRLFAILFGTATIVMFYFLCRRLGMKQNATIIATFLLAFENLTFVQNGMAMLDVFFLTFMMAAFLLYASRRYISSGVAVGLAGLAKLNGLLALPTIVFHWIFTRQGRSKWILITIVVAVIAFLEIMILCDLAITRDFSMISDPIHRVVDMTKSTAALTFHNYPDSGATYPWTWLYIYKAPLYSGMPHWYGAVSFSIWALIIPTFIYMIWRAFKKDNAALFGVGWFTCVFLVWIPATLITDRLTYPFYIYPAIGAICLGLGIALNQMLEYFRSDANKKLRIMALTVFIVVIVAHVLSFLILSPIIPIDWAKLIHLY
jgi:predicted membrane-bound dolichyl-phosphate-mannose-protein mannosyltransferase